MESWPRRSFTSTIHHSLGPAPTSGNGVIRFGHDPPAFRLLDPAGSRWTPPCRGPVHPTHPAATQVQGEVRVCPGRYRIADPRNRASSSPPHPELTSTSRGWYSRVATPFRASSGRGRGEQGVDAVTITGGGIHGYRYGVRIEGGRGHRVVGTDLSGSRSQGVRSTPAHPDPTDRLDLERTDLLPAIRRRNPTSAHRRCHHNRSDCARSPERHRSFRGEHNYIADNDVAFNNGWGIQGSGVRMAIPSREIGSITPAAATHRFRAADCAPPRSCSAMPATRIPSSTIISERRVLGFLLSGDRPLLQPSVGNLVFRNDASSALRAGFTVVNGWGNTFLENRADSAGVGFRLDHSGGSTLRANTVIGARGGES